MPGPASHPAASGDGLEDLMPSDLHSSRAARLARLGLRSSGGGFVLGTRQGDANTTRGGPRDIPMPRLRKASWTSGVASLVVLVSLPPLSSSLARSMWRGPSAAKRSSNVGSVTRPSGRAASPSPEMTSS
eukprot:9493124-Pyramimonas_sp.AAC.2